MWAPWWVLDDQVCMKSLRTERVTVRDFDCRRVSGYLEVPAGSVISLVAPAHVFVGSDWVPISYDEGVGWVPFTVWDTGVETVV